MKIRRLSNDVDIKKRLKALDVDRAGVHILASKHRHYLIEIRRLHVGAANILKQDALSVGADLAVPKGTIVAQSPYVDALLIATHRELERLAQKEKLQPFGLKELAAYIQKIVKTKDPKDVRIMGVINANDDSFYAGSRFRSTQALEAVEKMVEEGAHIIDIGGVSSRPGAAAVDASEELERVRPIIDALYAERFFERVQLSIDSYAPEVVLYALEKGFGIVNDITGLQNDEICRLCAHYDATAVIMHMQGTPQTMQLDPRYEDVVGEVYEFFEERIAKAESFGVKRIVLDVGIGFGKSLEHNIALLQHLSHFRILGKELLVGASRKSMIDRIFPSSVEQRLAGTLALHLKAAREGADILRVHDVYEHAQALRVWQALEE